MSLSDDRCAGDERPTRRQRVVRSFQRVVLAKVADHGHAIANTQRGIAACLVTDTVFGAAVEALASPMIKAHAAMRAKVMDDFLICRGALVHRFVLPLLSFQVLPITPASGRAKRVKRMQGAGVLGDVLALTRAVAILANQVAAVVIGKRQHREVVFLCVAVMAFPVHRLVPFGLFVDCHIAFHFNAVNMHSTKSHTSIAM